MNHQYLLEVRRHLRNEPTPAEKYLWQFLRRGQLSGFKFRRQASIGKYIVDFYCPQAKLAVELDGNHHMECSQQVYDAERTDFLSGVGIYVLRFPNELVLTSPQAVLDTITACLGGRSSHHP